MPFKSEKQEKLCWTLYSRAKKLGRTPSWDCEKWEKETSRLKKKLPKYKSRKSRKSRKSKK